MEIITRKEARTSGLLHFFTGKPCKHGHVAQRLVSNRICRVCVYTRTATWRASNPEKAAKSSAVWRMANPEKRAALQARREATKRRRTPQWASLAVENLAFALARIMSDIRGEKYHVDHIVPLKCKTASGLHVGANFCVIPGKANVGKQHNIDERQLDGASLRNTLIDLHSHGYLTPGSPHAALLRKHEDAILELL